MSIVFGNAPAVKKAYVPLTPVLIFFAALARGSWNHCRGYRPFAVCKSFNAVTDNAG
jgi:hypothetical protein